MNFKKTFRLLALVLVVASLLSFASCGKKKQSGDIVNGTGNNGVSADYSFVSGYNNWFKTDAFENFSNSMKKTSVLSDLYAESTRTDDQKLSEFRELVSTEIKVVLSAICQYESGKNSYLGGVKTITKVKKGVYKINKEEKIGTNIVPKNFELSLNEGTRAIKLVQTDLEGNEIAVIEFIVTSDGYIAWQRVGRIDKNSKWGAIKILFKANEGYYTREENLAEKPQSIYPQNCYEGFAGKK